MAATEYGRLVFQNDLVVVYEVRAHPAAALDSTFVVPIDDPDGVQAFGDPYAKSRAGLVFSKARRGLSGGIWPTTVVFQS